MKLTRNTWGTFPASLRLEASRNLIVSTPMPIDHKFDRYLAAASNASPFDMVSRPKKCASLQYQMWVVARVARFTHPSIATAPGFDTEVVITRTVATNDTTLKQEHPREAFTHLIVPGDVLSMSRPLLHRTFCFRNQAIINWRNFVDSLLEQVLLQIPQCNCCLSRSCFF